MAQSWCLDQGTQLAVAKKGLAEAVRRDFDFPNRPSWKLYENPFYDDLAAAVVAAASAAAAAAMAGKQQARGVDEEVLNRHTAASKQLFVGGRGLGVETTPFITASTGESSSSSQKRASLSISGSDFCEEVAQIGASRKTDAPQARRHGAKGIQSDYGDCRIAEGICSSKEARAPEPARGRATLNERFLSRRGPAALSAAPFRRNESAHQVASGRALGEENALLGHKPFCLHSWRERVESLASPCSHLQPRPPSSTSDSPCSAKPIKAVKIYTRSPHLRKSSEPIPPLENITLMRPKAVGDGLHVQKSGLKSASSSHQSSVLDADVVERLLPHSDSTNLADADLITSPRDYLKTFNRPCGPSLKNKMESSSVVSALSEELKRALTRVHDLEHFQSSARKEVDGLLRRFADERALLKNREHEKIQAAVFLVEEELDEERKVRKKLELEIRKLSKKLAEANRTVDKVKKELGKERRARQLMEDVCDELAREIGEDKAEVEELKREHARAREDIEEERRTLQMTEAWREERMQMKLSDAKYELEERCLALDKLKLELEMFLNACQAQGGEEVKYDDHSKNLRAATEEIKAEASSLIHFLDSGSFNPQQFQVDTLSSDDIQSLRLSRDNIRSQSEWTGYTDASIRDRARWTVDDSGGEPGSGITYNKDINSESGKVLSTFLAYPKEHTSSSWFSPKPNSRWAKERESFAGLVSRVNSLTFDGSDSREERNLDEENEVEDDSDTAWRRKGFGEYETGKSEWNTGDDSSFKGLNGDIDKADYASEEEGNSGASNSPKFRKALSKQRGFTGRRMRLNQGFLGTVKCNKYDYLDSTRINVDDVDGASSITGLSSPNLECNNGGPDLVTQVIPTYRSSSQGRKLAVTNSTASRRRRDLIQRGKLSSRDHNRQTALVLDDRKIGPPVSRHTRQHLKGPMPTT